MSEVKSYWNDNAKYSKQYKEFWDELVPDSGEAETIKGELVRIVGRITHEYYNNGNCNAVETKTYLEESTCWYCSGEGFQTVWNGEEEVEETCSECDGAGYTMEEYDGETFVTEYYQDMFDFIQYQTGIDAYDFLDKWYRQDLYGDLEALFNKEREEAYTDFLDKVMETAIDMDPNKKNPNYKPEKV